MLETLDPRIVPSLTAVTDPYTLHQGAALTNLGNVRANDLGTNSITKAVLAAGPDAAATTTFTFGSHGANVAFRPKAGTIAPNGTITNGFTGTTSFDYFLRAGTVTSNTVTNTITVTNTVPVAETTSLFFTTGKNQAFHIDKAGMGLVTDADGDTVGPVKADHSATNVTFATAAGGTVYLNWITGFSYNPPDQQYEGYDSFEFCWWDKAGFSNTVTVNVMVGNPTSVMNNSPTAPELDFTTPLNTAVTGNLLTNASDEENDPLTVAVADEPTHGTLTLDEVTGEFEYTPDTGFAGTDSFTYTISDGAGGVIERTVHIAVGSKISGIVFWDANEDGYLSPGESGLAGYTIQLVSVNSLGEPVAVVDSTVTTDGGLYAFHAVADGDYRIRILDFNLDPAEFSGPNADANGFSIRFTYNNLLLPLVLAAPVPKVPFEVSVDFTNAPTLGGYDLKIYFDVGTEKLWVAYVVVDDKMTSEDIAAKVLKDLKGNKKLKDLNFTVEADGTKGLKIQGAESIGSFRFETRDVLGMNVNEKLTIKPIGMPVNYNDKEIK